MQKFPTYKNFLLKSIYSKNVVAVLLSPWSNSKGRLFPASIYCEFELFHDCF